MTPDNDTKPFPVDELARRSGMPVGYIQLAIDCGCPAKNGLVTHAGVALWVLDNYKIVRARAGLPPLPESTSSDSLEQARVRVRNCLRTLADYKGSRSSDLATKQACRELSRTLLDVQH